MGERVHAEKIELREAVVRTMGNRGCQSCHAGKTYWQVKHLHQTAPKPVPIAPSALLFAAGLAALLAVKGRKV